MNIDNMSGERFEKFCAIALQQKGFKDIQFTKKTADRGADIIAYKNGFKYVIQCKRYTGNVGNAAIQQVYSAKDIYDADYAIVMTNSEFTQQAIDDATKLGVELLDRTFFSGLNCEGDYYFPTLGIVPELFIDAKGIKYPLTEKVSENINEIWDFELEYVQKAHNLAEQIHCDVFYSLRSYAESGQAHGNFFIIPISDADLRHIQNLFSDSFIVGIVYHRF